MAPFRGTPENAGVMWHLCPLLGPREGRGEVAKSDFVPFPFLNKPLIHIFMLVVLHCSKHVCIKNLAATGPFGKDDYCATLLFLPLHNCPDATNNISYSIHATL